MMVVDAAETCQNAPKCKMKSVVIALKIVETKTVLTFFLIAVCLRIQSNPLNSSDFKGISPERAFADFIFASVILHLVVMNFIG